MKFTGSGKIVVNAAVEQSDAAGYFACTDVCDTGVGLAISNVVLATAQEPALAPIIDLPREMRAA